MKAFRGFLRKHGPAGIRNHVLIISAELACSPWAAMRRTCSVNCLRSGVRFFTIVACMTALRRPYGMRLNSKA